MLVVVGLVIGGELLWRRRGQGRGPGTLVLGVKVVSPGDGGRGDGGKGAEEEARRDAVGMGRREATRAEEEKGGWEARTRRGAKG